MQSDIENFGLPNHSSLLDPPPECKRKVNSGSALLMPVFVKTVHAYVVPDIEPQDVGRARKRTMTPRKLQKKPRESALRAIYKADSKTGYSGMTV